MAASESKWQLLLLQPQELSVWDPAPGKQIVRLGFRAAKLNWLLGGKVCRTHRTAGGRWRQT